MALLSRSSPSVVIPTNPAMESGSFTVVCVCVGGEEPARCFPMFKRPCPLSLEYMRSDAAGRTSSGMCHHDNPVN